MKELLKTLACAFLALALIGGVCWAIWTVVLRHELKKPVQAIIINQSKPTVIKNVTIKIFPGNYAIIEPDKK
jgi:predicted transglutaminase-like protease